MSCYETHKGVLKKVDTDLIENQDKIISVNAQFYNGGTCIDEVINSKWDKLIKSKELSTDKLINLACKWLDYHHSNYVIKTIKNYKFIILLIVNFASFVHISTHKF